MCLCACSKQEDANTLAAEAGTHVFKAKRVPQSVFEDVSRRQREEALLKAIQRQMRAEELLRESALPFTMASRKGSRHLTIGLRIIQYTHCA